MGLVEHQLVSLLPYSSLFFGLLPLGLGRLPTCSLCWRVGRQGFVRVADVLREESVYGAGLLCKYNVLQVSLHDVLTSGLSTCLGI